MSAPDNLYVLEQQGREQMACPCDQRHDPRPPLDCQWRCHLCRMWLVAASSVKGEELVTPAVHHWIAHNEAHSERRPHSHGNVPAGVRHHEPLAWTRCSCHQAWDAEMVRSFVGRAFRDVAEGRIGDDWGHAEWWGQLPVDLAESLGLYESRSREGLPPPE